MTKNRIWVMVAESRVYCSTCDEWFLSDAVDYKDIKSNCHGEDVMVFRCEICGKRDESVVVLTNAPKADTPSDTSPDTIDGANGATDGTAMGGGGEVSDTSTDATSD